MKAWKIIIPVVVIVSAVTGYYYVNRPVENAGDMDADVKISSTQLQQAYEDNEQEADSAYLGKVIEVKGTVLAVNPEENTITLKTGSDMSCVSCEISQQVEHDLDLFKTGDSVVVKGVCAGYLMDVVLKQSVVTKK
ncbi:MAG TPA: hypothetical protein VFW78_01010 [Bacteroidia bacterium]|nr:hypothetical protein [Bacteroidia bacterium]